MNELPQNLLMGAGVGALGMISLTAGAIWFSIKKPSDLTSQVVQHIAAGTVFAGLVSDVLPRLLAARAQLWVVALGMAAGLGAMMWIRSKDEAGKESAGMGSLAMAIIADVLTDGVLMGLSIASGSTVAIVFVVALVPELTFLGVTLTSKLGGEDWSAWRRMGVSAGIGAGIVVGGVLGALARSGPGPLATFIEGFGAIALAYLVTEELLREAHRGKEKPCMAAMFFTGFVPLFLAAVGVR